jgi:hypothetical protein
MQPSTVGLDSHQFEILKLTREGEHWIAHIAVDGQPYVNGHKVEFIEPHVNVMDMPEREFLPYLYGQALGLYEHYRESAA